MSKDLINYGTKVDDGTGDYLRLGGQKINKMFTAAYKYLGDETRFHAAGAWQHHNPTNALPHVLKFGESWVIDTSANQTPSVASNVTLPQGSINDYGKVIRLRDVMKSWRKGPVTVASQGIDKIKDRVGVVKLDRDLLDTEFVYTAPNNWEYVTNKKVNKIDTLEGAAVAKREIIATAGQKDFPFIFDHGYNVSGVEIYRRGNLLYYGPFNSDTDKDNADYGSIDPNDVNKIIALEGTTIRLKEACSAGDAVTIVTYLDPTIPVRTSYNSFNLRVIDQQVSPEKTVAGQTFACNLLSTPIWNLHEHFGRGPGEQFTPTSLEVLINGKALTKSGTAGLAAFACEGQPDETDEAGCIAAGGKWVDTGEDFSPVQDDIGRWNKIKISTTLEHNDILTIKWYNNEIGATLDWDGTGGIKERTDSLYLNSEYRFTRKKKIEYTDPSKITNQSAKEVAGEETNIRWENIESFLESLYPVGSIYMNANNPNNPRDYMGFGMWVRFGEGKVLASWNASSASDDLFGNNNTYDPDRNHSAGGTHGSTHVSLTKENIPQLDSGKDATKDKALIRDDSSTGAINVAGCQPDPDDPKTLMYREDFIKVNQNIVSVTPVPVIQPFITVNMWTRVG